MQPTILIAEDHWPLRHSLRIILSSEGITQLDEVETCRELLRELKKKQYTHLILDITLGDGNTLELLPTLRRDHPLLKVLVYSSQPERLFAASLRHNYGVAYLSKAEGRPATMQKLLAFLLDKGTYSQQFLPTGDVPFASLTPKQIQIMLYLVKDGLSFAEIANKLTTTASTIRTQKERILKKTGAKNLVELKELAVIYRI